MVHPYVVPQGRVRGIHSAQSSCHVDCHCYMQLTTRPPFQNSVIYTVTEQKNWALRAFSICLIQIICNHILVYLYEFYKLGYEIQPMAQELPHSTSKLIKCRNVAWNCGLKGYTWVTLHIFCMSLMQPKITWTTQKIF